MKILVTGGAGFIGSAFVRLVVAETDWRVVNLDKLTYAGNLENLAEVEVEPIATASCTAISATQRLVDALVAEDQARTPSCISPPNRTWTAAFFRPSR